jgi:hypothetical protein
VTDAVVFAALAVAVALLGRVGWRQAEAWTARAWDDPIERDIRRRTVRRGAVACWIAAAALLAGSLASAIARLA